MNKETDGNQAATQSSGDNQTEQQKRDDLVQLQDNEAAWAEQSEFASRTQTDTDMPQRAFGARLHQRIQEQE